MGPRQLPLFPLRTVLFPGGVLHLRIFEPRYLDLVRECTRADATFGVCLILDGREVGTPALPARVGTEARIVDFHTLPDGMLGIVCRGEARFRVLSTRVRDNGLVIGMVEPLAGEPALRVPPQFALLATLLERMIERIGLAFGPLRKADLDDAGWVGLRLAELLPLELAERQELLELTDPLLRLARIVELLPRFQRE
ncbi:MAG: LON peptidase substrate-binding domain-containing protein [Xanthomonadales bacterium]|nr:LON peptidase substrate-binding domain-containing protein [Xanthomonadales bacterium]